MNIKSEHLLEAAKKAGQWFVTRQCEKGNYLGSEEPDGNGFYPDTHLALANVLVNKTERGNLYITADVMNNGFIPVSEGLEFDLKTQENITLDKQLVAALDPGEHHTITLVSSSRDLAYGEIEFNVIVDADNMIEESSKTDNIRSVSVINLPSFNIDNIGVVDMADFALFAAQWQRDDCGEPDWCGGADFELTGSVGIDELAKLAENWLKEL